MNNLTVDHHHASRLSKSRKSVIGKLERSSFQAQRLSDVGIAFSQQITAKVGLKLPASQERIVEQTRWLYLRYVFVKLRQNKLPLKDLNLTKGSRTRRAAALLRRLGGMNANSGGPGGASETSSPIVCISEPPSADVLTPLADQRPMFTRQPGIRPGRLSILSIDLDAQDLSLLNARMSSRRNQRLGATLEMPAENMTAHAMAQAQDEPASASATGEQMTPPPTTASNFDAKRMLFGKLSSSINLSKRPAPSQLIGANFNTAPYAQLSSSSASSLLAPTSVASATPTTKKYIMDPTINNQILTVITNMINQLRESKPEFYGDTIYEVIGLDKFSSLESLLDVQRTICQEMTRADISWDRIVALFSLFGAMSLDCVRLGAPEHVGPILDGFIGFVERDLAQWISQQGGWESFLYKFRVDFRYGPLYKAAAVSLPILLGILFAYN